MQNELLPGECKFLFRFRISSTDKIKIFARSLISDGKSDELLNQRDTNR